jgi:hypothetical protein
MNEGKPLTSEMRHPMQPIGWDGKGVARFKQNAIVNYLLSECARLGGPDLNSIAYQVALGHFPAEDQVQLAQLIGYSVSGFGEISFVPRDLVRRADAKVDKLLKG